MIISTNLKYDELYNKVRVISNKLRFRILELTQDKQLTVSELSSLLKLAYNRCSDYVVMLEKEGMIVKVKDGKNIGVKSTVRLAQRSIEFKDSR